MATFVRDLSLVWSCLVVIGSIQTVQATDDKFASCPRRVEFEEIPLNPAQDDVFFLDSVDGSDEANGRVSSPIKNRGAPFRTLGGALAKIRRTRRGANRKATLFIRMGNYLVDDTIVLDRRDAGIHLVGYPFDPETPKIVGGKRIRGSSFQPVYRSHLNHVVYVASFEGKCSKHVFLGNKRLLRARKPNIRQWTGNDLTGFGPYLQMANILETTELCTYEGKRRFKQMHCPEENKMGFYFRSGDIRQDWSALDRGEILLFNAWTAQRGRIASVDAVNNVLRFRNPLRFPIGMHPKPSGYRYVVENIFEELDGVGEFYCDQEAQRLYIIPPDGALDNDDVFLAQTSILFQIRRTSHISFSGLQFSYTHDKNFEGYNSKPGAIQIEDSKHVTIDRCQFSNIGYTAVYAENVIGLKIINSLFRDLGYQGVSVELRKRNDHPLATRDVMIHRNTFYGCGVSAMFQPSCVHVKGVRNIRVTDNDVSHTSYAGIKVGWQKVFTLDHVTPGEHVFSITGNNIYNYGNAILNDFAGVYLSSNMHDCGLIQDMSICHIHALIENNVIHHSEAYQYGAMGIYGDTAVSSLTVRNNWMYHLYDTAINFHCGQNNVASNNMIHHISKHRVFGTCNGAVGPGGIPRQNLTFERNVIYVDNRDPRMFSNGDIWTNDVPKLDHNDYFFPSATQSEIDEFFPKYISLEQWRYQTNNDISSVIEDPNFVDMEAQDYRLKLTSPALGIGIESVDLRNVLRNSGAC